MSDQHATQQGDAAGPHRRSFGYRFLTGVIGAVAGLVPIGASVLAFFSPLRQKGKSNLVRVASLEDVPADGVPRRYAVIAQRRDVWNLYPAEPIGAVFIRRTSEDQPPVAFSSVCPHLGCAVDYRPAQEQYQCPCHNSAWQTDGDRINPEVSPSPRGLDELPVEVRGDEVWVEYKQFRSGISESVPV